MQQVDSFVNPPTNRDSETLMKLINDHEDVSEYLEVLEEILGFLHEEEAWSQVKQIEDFFKRVISHFEFEEKTVFPGVLSEYATSETIKLILELQKEHGIILKELEEFQKIISENTIPLDKEMNARLNVVGRGIIDRFLTHASKEDDELLPILQKNRQIFGLPDEN
ncbi:TPA: hemerythrin domain-containing protein [Candidatus Poribacteria bacterium]|nr:hemerythrin domain-containing protein [Candidatus Poribacteria bacterium]